MQSRLANSGSNCISRRTERSHLKDAARTRASIPSAAMTRTPEARACARSAQRRRSPELALKLDDTLNGPRSAFPPRQKEVRTLMGRLMCWLIFVRERRADDAPLLFPKRALNFRPISKWTYILTFSECFLCSCNSADWLDENENSKILWSCQS